MILVIGGIASGKRSYAASLGYGPQEMSGELDANAPVLVGLEELLREGSLDERQMQALLAKELVTCCEVGMGVVPVDTDERAWRELVGRTCASLAAQAEKVVRMVCGIPQTIAEHGE